MAGYAFGLQPVLRANMVAVVVNPAGQVVAMFPTNEVCLAEIGITFK
jgi:hypothetical protein